MSIKRPARQCGITLVEQIIFIVIVSVGVIGLVSVMNPLIRNSADPMLTKQMAAVAEAVLNEALHQPFTWCDPEDATAGTALSYADCANPQNTTTRVPVSEARYDTGPGTAFDNVADYGGFNMANVDDASGNNPMAGFAVNVAVAQAGAALGLADNTAALSVTVTVTRAGTTFSLTGYRFRYAPRS